MLSSFHRKLTFGWNLHLLILVMSSFLVTWNLNLTRNFFHNCIVHFIFFLSLSLSFSSHTNVVNPHWPAAWNSHQLVNPHFLDLKKGQTSIMHQFNFNLLQNNIMRKMTRWVQKFHQNMISSIIWCELYVKNIKNHEFVCAKCILSPSLVVIFETSKNLCSHLFHLNHTLPLLDVKIKLNSQYQDCQYFVSKSWTM